MVPGSLLLLLAVATTSTLPHMVSGCNRGRVYLKQNGYRELLVAIDDEVDESPDLVRRIKVLFTDASKLLFTMSKKQVYFEDVHILIPKSWSENENYKKATWQNAESSEVTIGPVGSTFGQQWTTGDAPFTVRATPCGELGHFIHLTPQYLLNDTLAAKFGPREKVFIHEWSHLRYGVFDEYGYRIHFYMENNEPAGIRCPAKLKGGMWDTVSKEPGCRFVDGLPDSNCRFQPDTNKLPQGSASLMFDTRSKKVSEWCDNDAKTPETLHNRQAPSYQNNLCGQKSVWEVLRNHPDFKEKSSTLPEVPVTRFTVVQKQVQRTVLVLDVSGSMNTNSRDKIVHEAAKLYLQTYVKEGDMVGIVIFNHVATIVANLTRINSTTRAQLQERLSILSEGGTSIGAGLDEGWKVVTNSEEGNEEKGGVLILLTDGEENADPNITVTLPEVKKRDVIVHTIAVGEDADKQLEDVANETGGESFVYIDDDPLTNLNAIFQALASIEQTASVQQSQNPKPAEAFQRVMSGGSLKVLNCNDQKDKTYTIFTGSAPIDEQSTGAKMDFNVDSSANRDVSVLVQSDGGQLLTSVTVTVVSPNGQVFTSSQTEVSGDRKSKMIYLGRRSEAGRYQVSFNSSATQKQILFITVSTKLSEGEKAPIIVSAAFLHDIIPDNTFPQVLYASVSKGYFPVLNAVVEATITSSNSDPETLELLDNGAGSDVKKDDGVYSAYFTNFTAKGRFNVMVNVYNNGSNAVIANGVVGVVGVPLSAASPQQSQSSTPAEVFQRVTSGGSFKLLNFDDSLGDVFPPSRVIDLEVRAVGPAWVLLEWTAPGDDLDRGTAAGYVLKMTTQFEVLYSNHTQVTNVSDHYILTGSLTSPQSSGSRENITVYINEESATYYFAIQAYDNSSQVSPLSNIVSATTTTTPTRVPTETSFNPVWMIPILLFVLIVVIVYVLLRLHCRNRAKQKEEQNDAC